jgi:hypothetical protein
MSSSCEYAVSAKIEDQAIRRVRWTNFFRWFKFTRANIEKSGAFRAFPICDTVAGLRLRSSRCCAQVSQARQL